MFTRHYRRLPTSSIIRFYPPHMPEMFKKEMKDFLQRVFFRVFVHSTSFLPSLPFLTVPVHPLIVVVFFDSP